jgi:hypothetical protein
MIWFFERQQARLFYEIRRATEGAEYELVITHPDGREQVEAFTDASVLLERSVRLRSALLSDGWRFPGTRGRQPRCVEL